ncbi:protein-lysine methyltransferase METTL21D [Pimephales promelas]|nr:protein-lysine methyltransferase METTL21D [Pimephales promelas]
MCTHRANVTVTDLEDLQPLLKLNIEKNQQLIRKGSITAKSVEPLVETLKLLAGPETCIICCYEQRTVGVNPEIEKRFFELLVQEFQSEEIPPEKQDPEFNSPDIRLLHLRRRVD